MSKVSEFFGPLKRRPKYTTKPDGTFYSFTYFRENFRAEIVEDCQYRCVYCDCHEAEMGGNEVMELDHFRPWSRPEFAGLKNDPNNLNHGCPRCNRLKGPHWPSTKAGSPHDSKVGFVDPFNEKRADYFSVNDDGTLVCRQDPGRYIADLLQLHRPLLQRLRLRRVLRRAVNTYIAKMLPEIEAAKAGGGTLTREQLAAEWLKLKDYQRLLDLCDAPLKELKTLLSAAA
ncbi:MAG: putative endonuclease [Verrucomicrobia bacterium]|nr:putative endonuclease [Verrucomicrobiota bacterium]